MKKEKTPSGHTRAPRARKEKPPEEQPAAEAGSSLADIESGADMTGERDPSRAAAQLTMDGIADQDGARNDDQDNDKSSPGEEAPRRGRPPGSRNRTRTRTRATREQLAQQLEKAEARLAEIEAKGSPDREEQLARIKHAISGIVAMGTNLYIRGNPEKRGGWQWTPEELTEWGELWAEPLFPYMAALGTAGPFMIAAFGTANMVVEKASAASAAAKQAADKPEQRATLGSGVAAVTEDKGA